MIFVKWFYSLYMEGNFIIILVKFFDVCFRDKWVDIINFNNCMVMEVLERIEN